MGFIKLTGNGVVELRHSSVYHPERTLLSWDEHQERTTRASNHLSPTHGASSVAVRLGKDRHHMTGVTGGGIDASETNKRGSTCWQACTRSASAVADNMKVARYKFIQVEPDIQTRHPPGGVYDW